MQPIFTNDAVVLGILLMVLAVVFVTSNSPSKGWQKFYTYVPALLLCYFLPALLHWPLGLIASDWYAPELWDQLRELGYNNLPTNASHAEVQAFIDANNIPAEVAEPYEKGSGLYHVASRYLLPASLILLCLNIDLKGLINLGPKSLIMFFSATMGIVIGGPIALLITVNFFPGLIQVTPDELWRGLSTIAGSWIGGSANQTAMMEINEVPKGIFAIMIVVDVVVANIWMGFLLYGAGISKRVDRWLKADSTAIDDLKTKMEDYQAGIAKIPTTTDLFVLLAVAFGGVALSHWGADIISSFLDKHEAFLKDYYLESLASGFFWLIVISTSIGLTLSFTKARQLEGVGASKWGSVFIYILVATIGMHMDLGDILKNLGLFAVGIIWMIIHVSILLLVAKLIKAPFFFVAVGSQANIGGAASAPVVASAFSPALAPVGAVMAVLGYALGTYGALLCAFLMEMIAT